MWESEFDNLISKKDNVQYLNNSQLKLKVNYHLKKDEKLGTIFEPSINEDVINKTHLDENLTKIEEHISDIE